MNTEMTKVQKIIDEIYIYAVQMGSTQMSIDYKECDKSYTIHLVSNFNPKKLHMLDTLNKYLCVARHSEMEGYYWELTGNYADDTALTMVGMMTDEVDISYEDDQMEIYIVRHK